MSLRTIKNINRVVDGTTGEIIKHTEETDVTEVGQKESEPEFIKLYMNTISKLRGLGNSEFKVLFEITCRMPYAQEEAQEIVLNSFIKKKIADKLNVSEQYINDTITKLVRDKFLLKAKDPSNPKKRTGAYYINPLYIAKGKWQDVKELQLRLVFNANGANIAGVDISNINGSTTSINNIEPIVASMKV